MTDTFKIKEGDTSPAIKAILRDEDRTAKELSNVNEVRFHMRSVSTQDVVVDATGSVLSASEGKVIYQWADGDTDTLGRHQAEFEIEYDNGDIETFPNGGYIEVYVEDQVA